MPSSSGTRFSKKFRFDGFPHRDGDQDDGSTSTAEDCGEHRERFNTYRGQVADLREETSKRTLEVQRLRGEITQAETDKQAIVNQLRNEKQARNIYQNHNKDAVTLLTRISEDLTKFCSEVSQHLTGDPVQSSQISDLDKHIHTSWVPHFNDFARRIDDFVRKCKANPQPHKTTTTPNPVSTDDTQAGRNQGDRSTPVS